MIIIGNKDIPYSIFTKINTIEDIKNTNPNSTVVFVYDVKLLKYCYYNDVQNAILVSNIKDAIFCNSLNCSYIIAESNIAKNIQTVAQNYLFDSKVLQIILNDKQIEEVATNEIDGCIYEKII
jgi:hypothetical protein